MRALKAGMFGLAEGKDGEKYTNLRMNQGVTLVNESDIVVKKDAAERQLDAEKQKPESQETKKPDTEEHINEITGTPRNEAQKVMRRFYLSANLKDHPNPQRHVKDIFDEVITELRRSGADELKISLEVSFESSAGFSEEVINDVTANCKDIHVSFCKFEE